ncbi:MAG: hypothetical protein MUE71_04065 [Chitinophagaceae bacterium]|nr:hypothetical protein [Chitinophagaceae bacterium]
MGTHLRSLFMALGLWLISVGVSLSQPPDFKPDISRALFHGKLDESQKYLLAADGKSDDRLTPYEDEELNLHLTYQATNRIDQWQAEIENSTLLDHQGKLRMLRAMTELLRDYADLMRWPKQNNKQVQWHHLPLLLDAFNEAVVLNDQKKPLIGAIEDLPYRVALLINGSIAFSDNTEVNATKEFLLLKYLTENPSQILNMLSQSPNYTYRYADSLIIAEAYRNPERVVSYVQATQTPFSKKIRSVSNPMVKLLSELALTNQGQMFMPFLYQLSTGILTRDEINMAVRDSSKYYALLVKTQVENAGLLKQGVQVPAAKLAGDVLKRKSMDTYVNVINGLHDYAAPIRFKSIQNLSPQELYYLIVMNETEIYTSSYMYVYNRIFETMSVKSSDSLLQLVNYDKYKKFITMASNYNTLDNFLSRMSTESATALMTDFVNNLDKGMGEDDIEDAVDVANAYAAITDSAMRKLMRDQVNLNLENAYANNNKKAITIYRLEKLIMESSDYGDKINLSDSLGVQPIYTVKNDYLKDEQGRIVMQMYFYGDGAGKGSFNTLMGLMGDRNQWKINATPKWVQFTSVNTTVPFVLFANRALDEEKDLDEDAQRDLINWMGENGFQPSITVHRGHSYYLKYTIEKMLPSSKVVVLGSCGAYHNLSDVLKISPEAYIIASKQVGYGVINVQLFMYLINELKRGKDVAWPTMMDDVAKNVGAGRKGDFDDYIFPHRNLGAIFIKAYRLAMEGEI